MAQPALALLAAAAAKGAPLGFLGSVLGVLVLVGFLGLLGLCGVWAYQRVRDTRDREAQAERVFENEVLQQFRTGADRAEGFPAVMDEPPGGVPVSAAPQPMVEPQPTRAAFVAVSPASRPPEQPDASARPEAPVAPPALAAVPTSDPIRDWIRRLEGLGVLKGPEGVVKLVVPPDAPVWRLRDGRTCVLLPRVESEATLAHLAKRFDVVLAQTADGQELVITRVQTLLDDLVQMPATRR